LTATAGINAVDVTRDIVDTGAANGVAIAIRKMSQRRRILTSSSLSPTVEDVATDVETVEVDMFVVADDVDIGGAAGLRKRTCVDVDTKQSNRSTFLNTNNSLSCDDVMKIAAGDTAAVDVVIDVATIHDKRCASIKKHSLPTH